MCVFVEDKQAVRGYAHTQSHVSSGSSNLVMKEQSKSKIKSAIIHLLDEGCTDKTAIYKKIQSEFDVSRNEARVACKEVKIDLLFKLKALQSGMLEL